MKISLKNITTLFISTMFVLTLSACSSNSAEDAGEKLDEIATDAGNAVEDACESVKESVNAEDTDC